MSTHSLCGAQPDVQLHHEHVVTNVYRRGQVRGKHFRAEESENSKGGFITTEENCKNQTGVWSWILQQDGTARLF